MARIPDHLDHQRDGPNKEERIERRVNALIEAQHHLDKRDNDCNHTLSPLWPNRRLGVGNHKEDEELIFRASDWRKLREPWVACEPGTHEREENERRHVRRTDMETPRTPDDERTEYPDHGHRRKIVTPLNAQCRNGIGGEEEHGADAEVRWVEEVAPFCSQHIFRSDREKRADGVRPVSRRT